MSYEYQHLLDPALYSNSRVARFVDELLTPEIESLSYDILERRFDKELPPTDDIMDQIEIVEDIAKTHIRNNARFDPFFIVFNSPKNTETYVCSTPTTTYGVHSLLMLGKCFAFTQRAQSIFFATEMHHSEGVPIFGKEVQDDADWGIYVIGSSVRGNSFRSLTNTHTSGQGFDFQRLKREMGRDGQCDIPFSRFFQIKDEDELTDIVEQLQTINIHCPPTRERDPLINFAVVLQALCYYNYVN